MFRLTLFATSWFFRHRKRLRKIEHLHQKVIITWDPYFRNNLKQFFIFYRSAADYMNTRNAFHGLDEGLNTLAPKFGPAKLSFQTRTKSLLDEDDYFRANLPPTYDMEPLPVDAFSFDEKIISTTATRGGLISNTFSNLQKICQIIILHFF